MADEDIRKEVEDWIAGPGQTVLGVVMVIAVLTLAYVIIF